MNELLKKSLNVPLYFYSIYFITENKWTTTSQLNPLFSKQKKKKKNYRIKKIKRASINLFLKKEKEEKEESTSVQYIKGHTIVYQKKKKRSYNLARNEAQ